MNANVLLAGQRLTTLAAKPWLRLLFLAALGFSVHVPALQGQLLWDDVYLARDNPFMKSPLLALEAFRHQLFIGSASAHYRPVQNLSYMLDYYLWNTEAAGFHLTNIVLHVASALLLYRLLLLLFRKGGGIWPSVTVHSFSPEFGAFLIAAIWIVHPVHSAAVDYISGRADSLAFTFAAGGWLLALHGNESRARWRRVIWYALAVLCGLLALCSREIACIWIVLFLTYTFAFTQEVSRRKKLVTLLCCLVLLCAYAALRQLPHADGSKISVGKWPASVRAILMLRALGDYARLIVWPANLHMERTVFDPTAFRNHEKWRSGASIEYLSLLGLFVTAAFGFGCARRSPGQRLRILGTVWFFAAFLPVSNIVQLNATVAEHWLYLPSAGVFIFLIGCAVGIPRRTYHALGPAVAFAIIALGVRSIARSGDWRDEETFFTRTCAAGGRSGRVMVNLAQSYANRGAYVESEKICRRILQLDPHYSVARNNLAFALAREGKVAEAEALFAQSSQEAPAYSKGYPRTWIAARNYAQLRHSQKDDASAIGALERARIDYPDTWELISLESELLRATRGPVAALEIVHDFAERNWWHHAARLVEGQLYAESNDMAHAEEALRFAALLDVHDVEALDLLARIYARQNRLEEARQTQSRAVARQPDRPTQYCMLAAILEQMGRGQEADATLAKVSRMRAMANAEPAQPLATMAN